VPIDEILALDLGQVRHGPASNSSESAIPRRHSGLIEGPGGDGPASPRRGRAGRISRLAATYRRLLDVAPMAIGLVEVRGEDLVLIEANAATARFLGRTRRELLGRSADQLGIPARVIEGWLGQFREAGRARGELRFEFTQARAPGTARFAAVVGAFGVDPPRFSFVVEDVTGPEDAERAVRESEARLQGVLDSSKAVVYLKDLDGRYQLINRQWADLFGVTKDSVMGKTDIDLFPREHAESFRANDLRALDAGEAVEMEETAPHADGIHTYLSIKAPLVGADGRPYATCGISTDITERKRMELALRDGEDRIQRLNGHLGLRLRRLEALRQIDSAITSGRDLRSILGTITDRVLEHLDVDAAVVRVFDEAAGVREFTARRGHAAEAVVSPLAGSENLARRVAREGCPLHVPDLARAPLFDPSVAGLLESGFAAYHAIPLVAKGRVNGVLELMRRGPLDPDSEWLDFAETLAGQAAIAIEYATVVLGLRGAHAGLALAYEATIEGWSRVLDLRDKETEGHSRRVTEMTVRMSRAMGIDEADLIHIRRGALLHDIGKMGIPDAILLKPGPLTGPEWAEMRNHPDLAVAMLEPIEFLRPSLEIPHCHHERWDGTGYPRGLRGEEIPLSARIFAAVDIWDALSNDRPYRRSWSPEEVREHIRSLSGTHLEPRVVEVFLAHLADEPASPGGDPVSGGPPDRGTGPTGQLASPGGGEPGLRRPAGAIGDHPARRAGARVLVAEDDEPTARALAMVLKGMGHDVVTAPDGEEAWKIVRQGGIRIVVADWMMPGLEGPELCRRIRAQSGRPYTYVVLITGRGSAEDRLAGLVAGADDFLAKPIDPRELVARLEIARRNLSIHDDLLDRAAQAERMQSEMRRQNERLAELVVRDPLTGLYNRRHLLDAIEAQRSLSDRRAEPLSCLILDIDRFKRYNDDFGHPAGDAVLIGIAEVLRTQLRDHDLIARYGGEEFVALLPGCDESAARALAERVRAAIAGYGWERRQVTASLGIATYPSRTGDGSGLIDSADQALYRAKRAGRDRVIHRDDPADLRRPPIPATRATPSP